MFKILTTLAIKPLGLVQLGLLCNNVPLEHFL